MADPGLKSKFVEMQQHDRFNPARQERQVDNYELSYQLDVARITEQLQRAVHPRHRKVLKRALKELEEQRK